jgi:hypothetical protein
MRAIFARKGDIIPDGDGRPAFQFVRDVYRDDLFRAADVVDLRTGRHPQSGTLAPDFVDKWRMQRRGELDAHP